MGSSIGDLWLEIKVEGLYWTRMMKLQRKVRRGKIDSFERTSYHRGPSAHILINFSLNSSVSLSMFLRSNFPASIVRSDFKDMVTDVSVWLW
jgi:hypothetical protein